MKMAKPAWRRIPIGEEFALYYGSWLVRSKSSVVRYKGVASRAGIETAGTSRSTCFRLKKAQIQREIRSAILDRGH